MTEEQNKAHRHLLSYLPKRTFLLDGQVERIPFEPNWLEKDRPLSPSEKYLARKIEQALPITPSCSDSFGIEPFQSTESSE